jgi:two-component system chemotaxis response regulator CheB
MNGKRILALLIVPLLSPAFGQLLAPTSALPVHVATHGEQILPGHAYIAPDGFQMKPESGRRLCLAQEEPVNGHRPSVSYLFRSVAEIYGPKAVGVLLTGMGKDGAEELKLMRECGAVTIAQDQESSVVHGMPGEAIRLEAATYVLPPNRIAAALANLTNKRGAHAEG